MKRCRKGSTRVDGACRRKSVKTLGDSGYSRRGFPWGKVVLSAVAGYTVASVLAVRSLWDELKTGKLQIGPNATQETKDAFRIVLHSSPQ